MRYNYVKGRLWLCNHFISCIFRIYIPFVYL